MWSLILKNGVITTIKYDNIDVSYNTKAEVTFEDEPIKCIMKVDRDGDGVFEKEVMPTNIDIEKSEETKEKEEDSGLLPGFDSLIILVGIFITILVLINRKNRYKI